jgi:integrase
VPSPSNLREALLGLCDKAGVTRIQVHGLRHVHAALLAGVGLDPHSLRKRLGHAHVSTSMSVYAYAIQPDSVAVDAFERAIAQ